MAKRAFSTALAVLMAVAAVGVTVALEVRPHGSAGQSAVMTNPPFRNELQDERVTPDPSFRPTVTTSSVYRHVTVFTAAGRKVVLDAARQPLLFTAYWCPHCQRTLVLLSNNLGKLQQRPAVISMGFVAGTTLAQGVRIEQSEMSALHLHGLGVYYLLDPDQTRYVPETYPTLVFPRQGTLQMIDSEHTLAVWRKALRRSASKSQRRP